MKRNYYYFARLQVTQQLNNFTPPYRDDDLTCCWRNKNFLFWINEQLQLSSLIWLYALALFQFSNFHLLVQCNFHDWGNSEEEEIVCVRESEKIFFSSTYSCYLFRRLSCGFHFHFFSAFHQNQTTRRAAQSTEMKLFCARIDPKIFPLSCIYNAEETW